MLYNFQIELSDVSLGIYESLNFRTAQHPSEAPPYLLTRVLAYVLSFEPALEFSAGGLSDPDSAALFSKDNNGSFDLWIEIGNPSAKKLHKVSKTAQRVKVYTYKNPKPLVDDINNESVHRAAEIEIYAFDAKFLKALEATLQKNNKWSLLHQDGHIDISIGDLGIATDLAHIKLSRGE